MPEEPAVEPGWLHTRVGTPAGFTLSALGFTLARETG